MHTFLGGTSSATFCHHGAVAVGHPCAVYAQFLVVKKDCGTLHTSNGMLAIKVD